MYDEKKIIFFAHLHSNYIIADRKFNGRKIIESRAGRMKLGVNALSEGNNRAKEFHITSSSKECVVSRRAKLAGSLQASLFFDEPRPCSI